MSKILLIEPDRQLADIYRRALSDFGYEVVCTPTAQAALNAADTLQPDLVILELQLVEHSGIEFLYEFRSYVDWQKTPVIVHTHVPEIEFLESSDLLATELGVVAYLYKPKVSLKELVSVARDQLKALA